MKKKLQELKKKQKTDAKEKAKQLDKDRKQSLEEIENSLYNLMDENDKREKDTINGIMSALKKYDEEDSET